MEGIVGKAAAAILGVALGDAMGLPFEFKEERRMAYMEDARQDAAHRASYLQLQIVHWLRDSQYSRLFSDDTVMSDLKMTSYAQMLCDVVRDVSKARSLQKALLGNMLRWCYENNHALFQGTGGHTRDFLRDSPDLKATAAGRPLCSRDFQPERWYLDWVQERWAGKGQAPSSYGNGAVMSAAPAAAVMALCDDDDAQVLEAFSCTHQAPSARLAHTWLLKVLCVLIRRDEPPPRDAFIQLVTDSYRECVARFPDPPADPCDVAKPFLEYCQCLQRGSSYEASELCSTALGDAVRLLSPTAKMEQNGLDPFGQLLSLLARAQLAEVQGQRLRFSQRGLNTVVIALYCVLHGSSLLDAMHLVLVVGGDTDTVGAVTMSIAGAKYGFAETEALFNNMVGLASLNTSQHMGVISAIRNARTLAERYMKRALLFAKRKFDGLLAEEDVLSLRGLEEPVWHISKGQLHFEMNGEGTYRLLAPDFPFEFVVDGKVWHSVEEFALNHNSFLKYLNDGLYCRLGEDTELQRCLLSTGSNELVPTALQKKRNGKCPIDYAPAWGALLSVARSKLRDQREFHFFSQDAESPLSNWFPLPDFQCKGSLWPSVEHYVQAQKFTSTMVQKDIQGQPNAAKAVALGRHEHRGFRRDWGYVKADIAFHAMKQKFQQDHRCRCALMETAPKCIVAEGDDYWGIGTGQGRNMLGHILMNIRNLLMEAPTADSDVRMEMEE